MGRSSVFSLEQIYRKQVIQTWSKIPEVFRYVNSLSAPAGTDYGYFGGGNAPGSGGPYSTVDRLDFTSDTTNMVTKGPLSSARAYGAATGDTSYGYAVGGGWPVGSLVDRVDYSNDSATASVKGSLETNTSGMGPVTNNTYGYFASGRAPSEGAGWTTEIQRIEYANDTAASVVKGTVAWPAGGQGVAGTGNMNYGWFGGGRIYPGPGYLSVSFVGRIDYANDTQTAPSRGPLTQIRGFLAATGNADYGYFGGGIDQNGPAYMSIVDRVDYSNDTANASPKGPLADGKHYISATGNTSYGYWAGGYGNTSKSQRVDFSNDTATAVVKGSLSQLNANQFAFSSKECNLPTISSTVPATITNTSSSPNTGYALGGFAPGSPSYTSKVDRIDFDNDTATSSPKGPLSQARNRLGSSSNQSSAYAGGGAPGPGQFASFVDRVDFASDTGTASPKGPLASNGYWRQATGNLSFGYFGGSYGGPDKAVQRIDYSNDTVAATPVGDLVKAHWAAGATGTTSYGYFGGGAGTGAGSIISRVDYASDSSTASPKGPLSSPRTNNGYKLSATGNSNYGYWMGAQSSPATYIDRLDYASDTSTAVAKGALPSSHNKYAASATGNSDYGYYIGGFSGNVQNVSRIDYANDTTTASPKGPLSSGRAYLTASSARENGFPSTVTETVDKGAAGYTTLSSGPAMGYVLGGAFPYSFSTVDRVDFSNDTATAASKGPLSAGTSYQAAVSSKDHGYSMGGKTPSNGKSSKVDRVDYANDTATAAVKGPLSAGVYRSYAGVGNKDYGYHSGGNRPGTSSVIDRIEYASDTSTATPKGNLASARYLHSGAGNLSYGYQIGGSPPYQNNSLVQRIDYGNDTATAVTKGNLNQGSRKASSTGNASYGYVGGGTNPNLSQITRIDYSNDTATSVAKGPLTSTRESLSSFSAPGHGYFTGGNGPLSSVDRMDYSNDTATAVAKGPLSLARGYNSGVSSRDIGGSLASGPTFIPRIRWVDSVAETPTTIPNNAYHGGGKDAPGYSAPFISTTQRIDYANDTAVAVVKGPLTSAKKYLGAFSSSSHGYFCQGQEGPSSPSGLTSVTDRLDYSNDTTAAVTRGNSPVVRYANAGVNNSTYGWVVGGNPGYGVVYRLEFANDNTDMSTRAAMSPNGASYFPAVTGNENYGWAAAGVNNGGTSGGETPVDRIDYSNDTSTPAPKGKIRAASSYRYSLSAAGDNNFGYFYGGTPGPRSYVDRLDYSNDTATAVQKGNLPSNSAHMGSASNSTHAYGIGGQTPSVSSTVTRIDYSNDTAAPSPKGPLSAINFGGAAASGLSNAQYQFAESVLAPVQPPFPFPVQLYNPATNKQHGYVGGGAYPTKSSVDRIDFTNDTATATPRGSLTATKYRRAGTGNSDYGYIGGGRPGPISIIDRIDYSNDSATATAKGPLSQARTFGSGAVGNANYGYWFGGGPSYTTKVDRLDFASDSSTTITRGSLTAVRGYGSAVGNQSYGYHCGGDDGNPKSNIDRVDYSNDTPTMSPKGQLSYAFSAMMADFSNANYGWLAGRSPGPARSIVDRLDFSNDTGTTPARGPLSQSTSAAMGVGDANYGYACGGSIDGTYGISTVNRVDYSNDTATASVKGPLSGGRTYGAGASAADNANP